MGKRKNKFDYAKWMPVIGIVVLIVLVATLFVKAQLIPHSVNIENVENLTINIPEGQSVEMSGMTLGAASDYCSGDEATTTMCNLEMYNLHVTGDSIDFSQATTTLGISLDGYFVSGDLTVATGTGTTTRMFAIQNTGKKRLCREVFVHFTAADATQQATVEFSVGTSSPALGIGDIIGYTTELIASTTIPTGTAPVILRSESEGDNASDLWEWDNGVWAYGTLDVVDEVASSTEYDGLAGKYHIECLAY